MLNGVKHLAGGKGGSFVVSPGQMLRYRSA